MTTSSPFRDLLHADGFTPPPKEGVPEDFFALKNPTDSAGFEPANLGTKGQHATPRPPKPVHTYIHTYIHTYVHTYIHTYIHTLSKQTTKNDHVGKTIPFLTSRL